MYLAEQLKVDAAEFAGYDWSGRTIKYHREQVRAAFGFREFARGDEDKLAGWLAEEVCPVELRDEQLREALLVRCRTERIEPAGRIDRIVGSARAAFEKRFCELTCSRLDELKAEPGAAGGRQAAVRYYQDSGRVFCGDHGQPRRLRDVREMFKRTCDRAGLGRGWQPRELRHSFVSVLSDHGVDIEQISDAVGHENSTITKTVYRHQIADVVTRAAMTMDDIFGSGA